MKVKALWAAFILAGCQTYVIPKEFSEPRRLTFSDEFEGSGKPDLNKWQSENYNRRDNPEGPDGWWDENYVKLDGRGHLVLSVAPIANRNRDDDAYDFASGMVSTKGLFEQRYGYFEARAKLPRQTGWWAAFWLFSESAHDVDGSGRDGTEIDIMEGVGKSDRVVHALHWDGRAKKHQGGDKRFNVSGLRDGFHTYGLKWSPTEYIFYVDGEETWRTDIGGVSQVPAYVKLTGEISTLDWATGEDWAGPIDPKSYPDEFIIDYVRVWSK